MTIYQFRLRFFTPFFGKIQHESNRLEFPFSQKQTLILTSSNGESLSNTTEFILSASGFKSECQALEIARSFKNCLLILGAQWHLGIDAGKKIIDSDLSDAAKADMIRKVKARPIDNAYGLSIFPEGTNIITISGNMTMVSAPKTAQKFGTELLSLINQSLKLTPKDMLSFELYNSSHYEKSIRSKFLTLILAVESLLELENRQDDVQKLVDQLKQIVQNSAINKEEKNSIRGTLKWLYKESIGQGLKRLSDTFLYDKEYGGVPAKKFLSKCYDVRSQLVHNGCHSENTNLNILSSQLDCLVSDLLMRKIGLDTF